jgi:hypothetical protein
VGDPDEQVEIEGPVLAVLEGSKAVEDQRFLGGAPGSPLFMEEQTVSAETFGLALDGLVRDPELSADLTETGASDQAMEEGLEEVAASQPIGGGEGL